MKRLILTISALLTLMAAQAQSGAWFSNGAFDDFAGTDFYKNGPNQEGIIWWEDGSGVFTMSRPGDGTMLIECDSAGGAGEYPLFGLNFNDTNDDGTGTAFEVDLSNGADITLDIENISAQTLIMDVKLEDANGVQSEIEPNVSDVTANSTWADPVRKALNGFTVAPGERKSITIDLSSVPSAMGGLSVVSYDNCALGPFFCAETDYLIDITKIKAVLFRVNFGGNNIDLSEGDGDHTTETFISGPAIEAYTGDIVIRSFQLGDVPTGIEEETIAQSMNVYPNPAKSVISVSYESVAETSIQLADMLGNVIENQVAPVGSSSASFNTSSLTPGVYLLSVNTSQSAVTRKVIIE